MATNEPRSNGNGSGAPAAPQPGPPPAQAGPVGVPAAAALRRKKSARRAYLILAGLAGAVVATYYIHGYLTRNLVSTDDAEIDADVVPVAARVGGVVREMKVHDNDLVAIDPKTQKPPVIARIDPADYQAKVDAATAERDAADAQLQAANLQVQIAKSTAHGGIASSQAAVAGSSAQAQAASAQVAAAQAQVANAKAQLGKALGDYARAKTLHDQGAITGRELEAATTARDSAQAMVDAAQANLLGARGMQSNASAQIAAAQGKLQQITPEAQQIDQANMAVKLAQARLDSAKAQLALATLQRDYTEVIAPATGYVSKLAVHEGQLVQPGQTLLMLVPSETYVIANFKETQIARIKPGQVVDISVDAVGGKTFEGVVDSIAPGTGARFSMLPPDNATGNYVKVVQRVPVKIRWKSPPGAELRAGLSAEVTIHLE